MSRWVLLWTRWKGFLLEAFLLFNLAFLGFDIWIAHSVNRFAHQAEWAPLIFSATASALLLPVFVQSLKRRDLAYGRMLVICVGALAILVGLVGLYLHLQSHFLSEKAIKHLVYTAPFAAPLAYSGVGSLLIVNRLTHNNHGWSHAVAFAALGAYFANFVLALCDHAQNGFHSWTEWIPVFSAALATGFLAAAILLGSKSREFLKCLLGVISLQMVVGVMGFGFHNISNWNAPTKDLWEKFIHGAPAFAPLLFVNIALLSLFAWVDWVVLNLDEIRR